MLLTPVLLVALSQVCYRLPFNNPNLADGFGATAGRTNPHRGVDFPQPTGRAIPSVADGTVVLKTSTSCLGNVVVVRHDDGWHSGYVHLRTQSPLATGTRVALGQTIGEVGATGTCQTGPHLHLSMSPSPTGVISGTVVDPYAHIVARQSCNTAPAGFLDSASCAGISGWAYDPNATSTPIEVHLYLDGPAGSPQAQGFRVRADLQRPDLPAAYGNPHGYTFELPYPFFDGKEHAVYAYGIDTAGGANTLLGSSPKTLRCDAVPLPAGAVKRYVSADAFSAWKLALTDLAPLSDAALAAVPLGAPLSASPVLVKEAEAIFVREHRVLRHVPNLKALQAWRLDAAAVTALDPTDLTGAPWSTRPLLVKGSSAEIYLIDSPPPLWAGVVELDAPARLAPGETGRVTVRLENLGSLEWTGEVELAPVPRDQPSAFCAPSWPSCTRVGPLPETGALEFYVFAPMESGAQKLCFNLVSKGHWASSEGQGGPADEGLCATIDVVAQGTPEAPGAPGVRQPGQVLSGGCSSTPGAVVLALLALAARLRTSSSRGRRSAAASG